MNISDLRGISAQNKTNSSHVTPMSEEVSVDYDFENDELFMQECTAACMPTMLQMMAMGEAATALDDDDVIDNMSAGAKLDEAVTSSAKMLQNYLEGQGLVEAAAVNVNNPKINVVRLNKQAQISRLKSIIEIKMARKANHKSYKKYKIGRKIVKENRAIMDRTYGQKAERLAKKL